MKREFQDALLDPLVDNNPIGLQVLGICSALAVTTQLSTAFVMCVSVLGVLTASSLAVTGSAWRLLHHCPTSSWTSCAGRRSR